MNLAPVLTLALIALKAFIKNPKKSKSLKAKLQQIKDAVDAILTSWED